MVALSVIAFSVLISYVDLKKHLIYNFHLALFAIPLMASPSTTSFLTILVSSIFALVISLLCRIGGGDLKLFCLLLVTNGALITTHRYFTLFFITLTIAVLTTMVWRRNLNGALPLAPSILAPFLFLYLDI